MDTEKLGHCPPDFSVSRSGGEQAGRARMGSSAERSLGAQTAPAPAPSGQPHRTTGQVPAQAASLGIAWIPVFPTPPTASFPQSAS